MNSCGIGEASGTTTRYRVLTSIKYTNGKSILRWSELEGDGGISMKGWSTMKQGWVTLSNSMWENDSKKATNVLDKAIWGGVTNEAYVE